jgi:carboxymethylenebutenolidase
VTDFERYILDEWAADYREGRLPRREFLRRITILAGGAAAGVAWLAGLGFAVSAWEVAEAAATPAPPPSTRSSGVTVPPDDPAIDARPVAFEFGATTLFAYLSTPRTASPVAGVSVVHENRGLLEHHKDVTRRLAKVGYAALAVDLASPAGGTDEFSDPAQVTAFLTRTPPEQLVAMLDAGVRYLRGLRGVRADRQGALGFCFGGGLVWRLATQDPDLRAVVPFYGPSPPLGDVPKIRAAVLAIYGALDTFVTPGVPAMRQALQQAHIVHEVVVYADARHAFFNDTGPNYNPTAAADAWTRTLAWLERWLS